MKTKTYIHIQAPCHEHWGQMSPAEKGRFCHSCATAVTDFTLMTDAEILNHLNRGTGTSCGRFAADQLDRRVQQPASAARKTFWAYLLSLCLPFMAAMKLNAQKSSAPAPTGQLSKPARPVKAVAELPAQVTDTVKQEKEREQEGGVLQGDLPMKPQVMGLIIQYDKVTKADTASAIVQKATGNALFKISPRAAAGGKKLPVRVMKTGEYTVQLLDLDSKMIVYKQVTVSTRGQEIFLDIPRGLAGGAYYLRMIHAATGKQFVDKLVVK